jgi:Arc/MetJ-type ribon-helix-helix transcriptional regulator
MITFNTTSDVEAWAKEHGGLDAVNEALARGAFGTNAQSIRTAIRYVEREELKITERLDREDRRERATSAAEQFANAAQRSAREAYISRWIAVISALVALLAVVFVANRWWGT